jgi:hypothetical protein
MKKGLLVGVVLAGVAGFIGYGYGSYQATQDEAAAYFFRQARDYVHLSEFMREKRYDRLKQTIDVQLQFAVYGVRQLKTKEIKGFPKENIEHILAMIDAYEKKYGPIPNKYQLPGLVE